MEKKLKSIILLSGFVFVQFLLLVSVASAGGTAYVGDSGDFQCTHNTIQSAIDDANNFTSILVAAGPESNRITYQENLTINRPMVLTGGYETCGDAISGIIYIDSPMVFLMGTGNGNVITTNTGNGTGVDFYRFEISNGLGNFGGAVSSTNTGLRLINSFVHSSNTNSFGGGIYSYNDNLDTQNYQLELRNTVVVANQALLGGGGGIYAENTNVLMDEDSGVSINWVNHANGNGGGIYLKNSRMDFYGGTNEEPNPVDIRTYRGISQNNAPQHGGGIYALNSYINLLGSYYQGGQNNVFGNHFTPLNINNNTADSDHDNVGDGGGVYITGGFLAPASLRLHRAKVVNNSAWRGGAFYVGYNTTFKMQRTRDQGLVQGENDCWSEECSVLKGNTSNFKGGALFVEDGATALISQTHITDNRSDYGTVLYVDSTDSVNTINLDQNLIVHNGRDGTGGFEDRYVIDMYNNSEVISGNDLAVNLMFNTVSDNHATQAVFAMNGVLNYLGVFSSIIHDPTSTKLGDLFGAFSSAEFDCVNANETTSIGVAYATLTRISADNPGFIVRNYDYHLKPTSAMKDYCDNSRTDGIVSITNDIDDDTRAVNDTGIPDFYGAWDLGADENTNSHTDITDVIFIDSFDW